MATSHHCLVNFGLVNFGLVNFGLVNFGLVNFGLVNFGLVNFHAFLRDQEIRSKVLFHDIYLGHVPSIGVSNGGRPDSV